MKHVWLGLTQDAHAFPLSRHEVNKTHKEFSSEGIYGKYAPADPFVSHFYHIYSYIQLDGRGTVTSGY